MEELRSKKMKNVHIIGTGGLAKELIGYILSETETRYKIKVCWAEDGFNNPKFSDFYKGNMAAFKDSFSSNDTVFIAISSPKIREKVYIELSKFDLNFDPYIHPSCHISEFATVNFGCILAPDTMLTGDPILNKFVFTNTEVVIGHDAVIEDFCTLFPKVEICGDCNIGKGCVFGINSIVLPGINIISGSKLDAGSILRESINEPSLFSGNPAQKIDYLKSKNK